MKINEILKQNYWFTYRTLRSRNSKNLFSKNKKKNEIGIENKYTLTDSFDGKFCRTLQQTFNFTAHRASKDLKKSSGYF